MRLVVRGTNRCPCGVAHAGVSGVRHPEPVRRGVGAAPGPAAIRGLGEWGAPDAGR